MDPGYEGAQPELWLMAAEGTVMSTAEAIEMARDLLYTILLLALPSLVVSLAIGLLISVLQTITSIQEQTLTFVPRIVAVALVLVFTTAWSLERAVYFTVRMVNRATEVTR
jgi:flagellar biosynthetic protein FliQ